VLHMAQLLCRPHLDARSVAAIWPRQAINNSRHNGYDAPQPLHMSPYAAL
jgi:hypothetical protein